MKVSAILSAMDRQQTLFEGLKHRSALVTGAARGIGRAIVEALARQGVHLILTGRDQGRLDQWAQELRQTYDIQVLAQAADLADASAIETLIRRIRSDYDKLDILINNAAVTFSGAIENTPTEAWDQCMAVNVRAPFIICRECLRLLRRGHYPCVINIASVVGVKGYAQQTAYTASKHALRGMSIALAQEFHSQGIRVHVICPGAVATDMVAQVRPDIPAEDLIQPEEIAETVLFLLTREGNGVVDEIRIRRSASGPWFSG